MTPAQPDHGWRRDAILVTLVAAICAPHVEIARLARLAQVDPLTGALNRRGLDLRVPELEADDAALAVAMVDLDHFKLVNDNFGHAVGDEVIIMLAEVLNASTRKEDLVGRYGGEEFIVLMSGESLENACNLAETIRSIS